MSVYREFDIFLGTVSGQAASSFNVGRVRWQEVLFDGVLQIEAQHSVRHSPGALTLADGGQRCADGLAPILRRRLAFGNASDSHPREWGWYQSRGLFHRGMYRSDNATVVV